MCISPGTDSQLRGLVIGPMSGPILDHGQANYCQAHFLEPEVTWYVTPRMPERKALDGGLIEREKKKQEEEKREVGAFLGGWGQSQGLGLCGIASSELCILRDRFPASGARHRTATDFRPRIGLRIRGWALGQCWGPGPENLKHLPK